MRALSLLLVFLLAGCKEKPSVWGLVESHRTEIGTYVAQLRAVKDWLGEAPTAATGFAATSPVVSCKNTVVIVAGDFERLRVDARVEGFENWTPRTGEVRPSTTFHLTRLIDATRKPRPNPPDAFTGVMEQSLSMMRETRFVAVPEPLEVVVGRAAGKIFTPSSWRGLVRVYDLAEGRWVGAVAVTVKDHREHTQAANVTSQVSDAITRTVCTALTRGSDTEGVER